MSRAHCGAKCRGAEPGPIAALASVQTKSHIPRVRRNAGGGLDLFGHQCSAVLTSTVWADGLVDNPGGQAIAPGDMVRYLALRELLA